MNYPMIALVHIEFRGKKFQDKDARPFEALLREDHNIYHVVMDSRRISFYIWGEDRINYQVLQNVKRQLLQSGYDFLMAADEYIKAGQKYFFDTREQKTVQGRQVP